MEENEEKKKTNPREIVLALIFIASFLPYVSSILVGMSPDGFYRGLQGGEVIYGSKAIAACYGLTRFFGGAKGDVLLKGLYVLTFPAFIYQIYYLIHSRKRKSVFIFTGVMIILLIAGGVAADPISRDRRANKDIEPHVMEYLAEKYGSDAVADMKIVIEKYSFDHGYSEYTYTVSGEMFDEPREIKYTSRWQPSKEEGQEAYYTHEIEES